MTTKRLIRNIALLLLPLALYYGVFLAFEPNNYFGLQNTTRSGSVIGALRAYEQHPETSILIGDSRFAHFDMALAAEAAGHPYANLAFGGASLREMLDLLEWWTARYPDIDEVVLGVSFYTLNQHYDSDRIESVQQTLENPVAYLTSLNWNLEAMNELRYFLAGEVLGGGEAEQRAVDSYLYQNPDGSPSPYPVDMVAYAERSLGPNTANWQLNEEQFARLLRLIDAYTARGVRFTVVLPPMHDSVWDLVVQKNNIDAGMQQALARLAASPAEVLDYEFTGRPDYDDTLFFDGFHLEYKRGLPVWTKALFGALANKPQEGAGDGA